MGISKGVDKGDDSASHQGIRGRPARIWSGVEAVAEVLAGPRLGDRVQAKRAET